MTARHSSAAERRIDYQALYRAKRGSLQDALDLIQPGDVIATGMYGNEPREFYRNLHRIAPRVHDVTLWTMLTMGRYPVMTDPALAGNIDILTFFYNEDCRRHHSSRRIGFVPMNLHAVGRDLVAARRPTVFVASVSPMDENGKVYLSFDLQATLECLECAGTVIFEVNRQMPRVYGETAVSIERASQIYEAEYPIPQGPKPEENEIAAQIAAYVSSLIRDGDCIQLGIGQIPNAVGRALGDKRDLGVHSEMIPSSMGELVRRGVITNCRKNLHTGKLIGAFAWGDQALYELLADNPAVELRRAAYVNDPMVIAQNDNFVSVNTALQIDLTGQICSESIGSMQYSGTGGASDFAYGAYHAKNGRGIIAICSTAQEGRVSRITAQLAAGSVVSISRNIVDYVVTEYGIAKLRGRTVGQRADALIRIAHPDFRSDLRKEADRLMLW